MAFTQEELANHLTVIEEAFWSKRRPSVSLRDKIREGQRITDQDVELFFIRPRYKGVGEVEEPVAKLKYVRSRSLWKIYWMRASGKWELYEPKSTAATLQTALEIIHQDQHSCFFG